MTKIAYIAGKITGVKDLNRDKFNAAERLLKELGYRVINPHKLCSDIHPEAHWSTFMKRCVANLPTVDKVVVLDDWYESKGAQIEVELACNLDIPVFEIETMQEIGFKTKTFPTYKGVILNIRL